MPDERRCRIIPRLEPYAPTIGLEANVKRLYDYLRIMQVWCGCCECGGPIPPPRPHRPEQGNARSQQHRMVPAENTARDSWDLGRVALYGGPDTPLGWLECDGRAVNRKTYARLFGIIGTFYGAGDGSTTFNLPDFRGRVPVGAGTGDGLSHRALGEELGSEGD